MAYTTDAREKHHLAAIGAFRAGEPHCAALRNHGREGGNIQRSFAHPEGCLENQDRVRYLSLVLLGG